MPHSLLIIEQTAIPPETSFSKALGLDQAFRCECCSWNSLAPELLLRSAASLIVAVASADLEEAAKLFAWIKNHPVPTPTLAVIPPDADDNCVREIVGVADDFVLWPVSRAEFRYRLERILGANDDEVEHARVRLTDELGLSQLVGSDPAFGRVVEKIPALARSDAAVLLSGETGTGKELCARAIHHLSSRSGCAFIPVDCGSVPDHLFENELFGHARGAFTDARGDQKGLAAMAEGGTLFFDEVDALSPAAQAKLLRFLQEKQYKALGSDRFSRSDVKIISATNHDIEACVREKRFRPDLYFRLNVLRLELPPLRNRRSDIPVLARYFLHSLGAADDSAPKALSPAVLHKLTCYGWPGNIRELFNVLQRAAVFAGRGPVLPCHICLPTPAGGAEIPGGRFREARARSIEAFERAYVQELMHKHHGNVTRAAIEAGKERRAFGRLVKKYDIQRRAV